MGQIELFNHLLWIIIISYLKGYHHHHQVTLLAQTLSLSLSLTLSLSLSLSLSFHPYYPSLPGLPDDVLCPYRAIVGKFFLISQDRHVHMKGYNGEHYLWVRLCFSSSVLHILFDLFLWFYGWRGKWPYSCCFGGCCFQDLFNIARSILVQSLSSFYSVCFVIVCVVHP